MSDAETLETVAVPVTIQTSIDAGVNGSFVVTDINAWAYQDLGVFATGKWLGHEVETDVLIPYSKIEYLTFDFDGLIEYEVEELIEEATSDDVSQP